MERFQSRIANIPPSALESELLITRGEITDPRVGLRWSDIRERCEDELFVWGWSCSNVISRRTRDVFKGIVENKVRLNFMVLSRAAVASASGIRFGPVCNLPDKDISTDIVEGVRLLTEFRSSLTDSLQHLVSIRETSWPMSWSGVALDPLRDHGRLQIEFYHYENPTGSDDHLAHRPTLLLTSASRFYEGFWGSLNAMWRAATVAST